MMLFGSFTRTTYGFGSSDALLDSGTASDEFLGLTTSIEDSPIFYSFSPWDDSSYLDFWGREGEGDLSTLCFDCFFEAFTFLFLPYLLAFAGGGGIAPPGPPGMPIPAPLPKKSFFFFSASLYLSNSSWLFLMISRIFSSVSITFSLTSLIFSLISECSFLLWAFVSSSDVTRSKMPPDRLPVGAFLCSSSNSS